MAFAPRPLLGKMRSFTFSGSTGGWVKLDPTLAGITDSEFLRDWKRRVWFAIMTPGDSIALRFTDPATSHPASWHNIQAPDQYTEYFYGGEVWVNNDASADDVYVVFGY